MSALLSLPYAIRDARIRLERVRHAVRGVVLVAVGVVGGLHDLISLVRESAESECGP